MVVRSTLLSSPDYSPDAISEHDVIARFHDGVPKRSADNSEPHRPLGLVVRQDSYQWSVAPLGDVIFLRYVIRTASPLTDVWVGVYTEFVSVNQSAQSVWPPSGAYHRSLLEYDAALRLLREHYCAGQPVPAGCQFATVPYWVGLESLTPPDPSLGQQTTIDGWQWGPQSPLRDTDAERYAIMSSGTARDWTLPDVMPGTGDPTELVAIGPYAALVPGDSIVVDFALLGGADVADIQRQAYDAQRARDLGFRDVPTPVLASVVDAQAEPGRVTVSWTVTDGLRDARIERRTDASPWAVLAAALPDASGAVRFDDRDVVPGTRYGYRLAAGSVTAGEAWVDVPGAAELAILPMGSDVDAGAALRVDYVLPAGTPAELRLVDVTGRVCATRALAAVRGRGAAELPCPGGPGVYWLRLAQGPRAVSRSVVVVR